MCVQLYKQIYVLYEHNQLTDFGIDLTTLANTFETVGLFGLVCQLLQSLQDIPDKTFLGL